MEGGLGVEQRWKYSKAQLQRGLQAARLSSAIHKLLVNLYFNPNSKTVREGPYIFWIKEKSSLMDYVIIMIIWSQADVHLGFTHSYGIFIFIRF